MATIRQTEGHTTSVIVASIKSRSPAQLGGILRGDIITAVNGKSVRTTKDVLAILTTIHADRKVVFTVLRDGNLMSCAVIPTSRT